MVTARLLFGDRVLKNEGACIVMRRSSCDHAEQPVERGSGVQRCWGNGCNKCALVELDDEHLARHVA